MIARATGIQAWHQNSDNVTALGKFLVDGGYSAQELQWYYEKPWNYDAEWQEFMKWVHSHETGVATA